MSLSEEKRSKTIPTTDITWLDEMQLTTPPTRKEKRIRIRLLSPLCYQSLMPRRSMGSRCRTGHSATSFS